MASGPCPFDHELLSRYVSCECASEERMRVERHVRTCRRCRHELYELEAVWSLLEEWQVDDAEAPFRPEALRANLQAPFGEPRRWISWRGVISPLRGWSILKPVPVAVLVGLVAGLLSWWDVFTGPGSLDPTTEIARAQVTPTPSLLVGEPTGGAKEIGPEQALREMDRSIQNLRRVQRLVGVQVDGRAEDVLAGLNRPSTPLPFAPPKANVIFASAHNRL